MVKPEGWLMACAKKQNWDVTLDFQVFSHYASSFTWKKKDATSHLLKNH